MATIMRHNGTQLVETENYYYLADEMGTVVSHGWRDREDAEEALHSESQAEWPAHDIELNERGYPAYGSQTGRGQPPAHHPHIEVLGLGNEDWTNTLVAEWERYGTIEVRIGGVTYEVGCVIGVPEYLRGTARAAGGDTVTPYLDAWFADSSDYMEAPGDDGSVGVAPELYSDLLAALAEAAPRLWQEHQEEAGE